MLLVNSVILPDTFISVKERHRDSKNKVREEEELEIAEKHLGGKESYGEKKKVREEEGKRDCREMACLGK